MKLRKKAFSVPTFTPYIALILGIIMVLVAIFYHVWLDKQKEDIDPPHEHTFVEGVCDCGEKDPDFHKHNFVDGKCECGESDPNYVPPHVHVWSDATCTEAQKCECGETQGEALGHTEIDLEAVEPTCTTAGKTAGKQCTVCNTITKAQEDISILAHTEVVDASVAATCTEPGLTEGKHCSVCNTVIVAQETVPAKGHAFINGKCECGTVDPDYVAPEDPNGPPTSDFPDILTVNVKLYNNYKEGFNLVDGREYLEDIVTLLNKHAPDNMLISAAAAMSYTEGGSGKAGVYTYTNNCFGIRAYSGWEGYVFSRTTGKVYKDYETAKAYGADDLFRAYDTMEESVQDYIRLISGSYYCKALDAKTPAEYFEYVLYKGYGEPELYEMWLGVVNLYDLEDWTEGFSK